MRSGSPSVLVLALLAGCAPAESPSGRYHGVVEIQEVRVGSKLGGRVAETPVPEGSLLKAGQVLARFESPEAEARREEAKARVREAEAALAAARAGPRTEEKAAAGAAEEAARAHLALLRAGPREEEVRAARFDLASAEAERARAEEDLARKSDLLRSSVATRDEVDAARAARDRLVSRRDAAQARLDLLLAGSRREEIEQAAAEARRLEALAALLEAGTRPEEIAAAEARLDAARARLAQAEADLSENLVRAPEDALLEVLAVRKGDLLAPGAPVARLHRASDLWVKVFVPETSLATVAVGQAATVSVDGLPGRTFAGSVAWIAAQAEFTPRNVQSADERRHQVFAVKVRVEDPQGVFRSGMAAEVAFAGAR